MNPITDKQVEMIKKVELLLSIKFNGQSKQDAFLWLRDNVPIAENKYKEILQRIKVKVKPTSVQNCLSYNFTSSSAKMLRLMELDRLLNQPHDLEELENIIVELSHKL